MGKIASSSKGGHRSSTPALVSSSKGAQEPSTTVVSVLSELHSLITQIQVGVLDVDFRWVRTDLMTDQPMHSPQL